MCSRAFLSKAAAQKTRNLLLPLSIRNISKLPVHHRTKRKNPNWSHRYFFMFRLLASTSQQVLSSAQETHIHMYTLWSPLLLYFFFLSLPLASFTQTLVELGREKLSYRRRQVRQSSSSGDKNNSNNNVTLDRISMTKEWCGLKECVSESHCGFAAEKLQQVILFTSSRSKRIFCCCLRHVRS